MAYVRNPNTNCAVCDKLIYRRPNEIKRNGGNVYCGSKCYGKAISKDSPCLICGKPILANLNKKTCSRSCANKRRIGGHYKIGGPRKDKIAYMRGLKVRLLEIREQKCQRCEYNKIEILQIHHKDRNPQNNDLDNLELICPNCHYEDHLLEKSWLKGYNLASQGEVG